MPGDSSSTPVTILQVNYYETCCIRSSKSTEGNIWTLRPASVPQRTALASACSSSTRSPRRTWWFLFTQRRGSRDFLRSQASRIPDDPAHNHVRTETSDLRECPCRRSSRARRADEGAPGQGREELEAAQRPPRPADR